jgi:ketosteroid isomerase-like protein
MTPEEFIRTYEKALGSQDWGQVEPLVHADACVTFSNGRVHKGKAAVQKAFEHNFSLIKDEAYSMTNVHWVLKGNATAVYLFEFSWSGTINGKPAQGTGRGTSVLIREADAWQLLVEHLGPKESGLCSAEHNPDYVPIRIMWPCVILHGVGRGERQGFCSSPRDSGNIIVRGNRAKSGGFHHLARLVFAGIPAKKCPSVHKPVKLLLSFGS